MQSVGVLCRGRSGGSEKDIDEAIVVLRDGASTRRDDDLALVVLSGIQKNLVGMHKADWTPSVVSNYNVCVSHLKNVRLEDETKKDWSRRYSELKDLAIEFNGGDKMLSLVVRAQLLTELKKCVDRAKQANDGDTKEMQAFIAKEAKAILQEWPDSELRKIVEKLSAE